MSNFTSKTFKETYRDFYDKESGYHRVLFNSGKALQARELNELQTILHEEIARFGRNIFREGATVKAGGSIIDNSKEYIRLQAGTLVPENIVGQQYQNAQGIKFMVEEYHEATDVDPQTLYVRYVDTSAVVDTSVPARVNPSEILTPVGATTFPLTVALDGDVPAVGTGTSISVNEGVFFVAGHFVHSPQQSTYIDKYNSKPTVDFGFQVVESVITEGEDVTLYDNQGAFPNTAAPGAHRYKIELTPTTRDALTEEENFVFVARIVNGVITREVDAKDDYNIINDLLATRTKEESGDYVAREFKTIMQDKDDLTLNLEVTPGTAYVDGYRLDFGTTNLDVGRARATGTVNNDSVIAQYGNYVIIDPTQSTGLSELTSFDQVSLGNGGTANVRAIENVGGEYRLYLFNIQMPVGSNFRDVTTITGVSGSCTLKVPGLLGGIDNTLLFPLPHSRPQGIVDTNFTSQRTIEAVANSSGEILISDTINGSYLPVIFQTGVGLATGWSTTSNKITGLTPSTPYIVTYYFESSNPRVRSKIPVTITENVTIGDGVAPVQGPTFIQGTTMWRVENRTGAASIVWNGELITTASGASDITTLNAEGFQYTRGSTQTPTFTTTFTAPTSTNLNYVDFVGNYVRPLDFTRVRASIYAAPGFTRVEEESYSRFLEIELRPGEPDFLELPFTRMATNTYSGPGRASTFVGNYTRSSSYTRSRASTYTGYYTQGEGSTTGENYTYYAVSRQALASSLDLSAITLDYADGTKLVQIVDASGNDVTGSFEFDGGQRDNYYGPIKLRLKSGLTAEAGSQYTVIFQHYFHGDGDYFSVESYPTIYSNVPSYKTSSGDTIQLTDVLDFRPVILADGIQSSSINTLPRNKSIISVDATYYLPRIDLLVANTLDSRGRLGTGRLQIIEGEAALDPRPPQVPVGSLSLFQIDLNAYTADKNDLSTTRIPHKRFTMQDIAKLEDRIDTLFELTTLSLLEADTATLAVLDELGNNRTKSGFIADNFRSLNFCDLNNPDYRASVEPTSGELMPSFRENSVRLAMRQSSAVKKGDVAVLPHVNTLLASQLLATGRMNINPFAVITQTGHMTLSPATDEWVEVRQLPEIMQSNVRRTSTDRTGGGRGGRVTSRIVETTIQEFLGEQVVDVEVVPFMRSREVYFRVEGLRPKTRMFAFFGNQSVQPWVRQENVFRLFSDNPRESGSEFASASGHPNGSTELVTDDNGVLIGSFFVPNTPSMSFRTGQQEFKLLDVSINDDDMAISSSRANYESVGRIDAVQRTIRSTRIVETISERIDPLAQTFFIDQVENPNGLFLTHVKVFMESKDSAIPLQVQIRPVENGIPTTRIVPGSNKFVSPSNINVVPLTPDTDIADVRLFGGTDIDFDEPVYLTPGEEYAIVLLAESVEYNAYVAETYEFILGPNQREGRVDKQPTLGSLFLSQNGSTWTPDQTRDLMFELYRAEFDTTANVVLSNTEVPKITLGPNPISVEKNSALVNIAHQGHGFNANDEVEISGVQGTIGGIPAASLNSTHLIASVSWEGYQINVGTVATASVLGGGSSVVASEQIMIDEMTPNIANITPNGTRITATVTQTSGASFGGNRNNPLYNGAYSSVGSKQVFINDLNLNDRPTIIASPDDMTFNITLSTTDTKVSPLIDLQRVSVMTLENVIDMGTAAQHITTPVILDESAVGLKILFSAHRPSTVEFEVYVKTAADESSLEVSEWVLVDADNNIPSDESRNVFREYSYTIDTDDQFNIFQARVVMQSTNSSKIPIISDFRTIALAV